MNSNLALQKPTSYEYQKPKKTIKKTRIKPHKNNSIYSIITISVIVISSYFITYDFYVSKSSQDLSYAVEYNFTRNSDIDKSLMRVQYMTLVNCDGKSATVEACGLSKASPHHKISLTGNFIKDKNNSWKLKKIDKS